MKIAYAFRRNTFYPYPGTPGRWEVMPPKEHRRAFLQKVRQIGFEGIELGTGQFGERSENEVRELRRELEGEGVPCAAVRGGGGLGSARASGTYLARWQEAIRVASWAGSNLVNCAISTGHTNPGGPGADVGERTSQGSSRLATQADYELTARRFREVADFAADHGVEISIEMHQHSIADNSWSCLHLLDLIDRQNVGVNPDLGNLLWNYEVPEETPEACIVALAPRAKYWHCKQLQRINVPELQKSYYIRVPLPDGDIDYRFALSAMVEANYQGYFAVEGTNTGDQLTRDARTVEYVRGLLKELGQ
jgi:sugar phosphate isomerase/epimerase